MTDNQEKLEQFSHENGMSLDSAWAHVKEWSEAGKNEEAIRGCEEIVKFFPDHEAAALMAKLKGENDKGFPIDHSKEEKKETVQSEELPKVKSEEEEHHHHETTEDKKVNPLGKTGDMLVGKVTGAISSVKDKIKEGKTQEEKEAAMKMESEYEEKIKDAKDQIITGNERLYGALSYAWLLVLIPLLFKKDSLFVQFHAKQGIIVFAITYLFQFFIGNLLAIIVGGFIKFVISIVILPVLFFLAFNAYSGKWMKIPVIFNLSKKINL